MKNKFSVILLCAAIVMSLCACKPLNIHSDGNGNGNNGGNNSASGAISVGFVVEEAGAAPEGAISISTPIPDDIINGDVVFQYKAIPGSTSSETIGATGDEWKALPSVFTGLGEEFKMDFSAGEWTFDLQGVDKEDSTLKYKLTEQVKANITANFKDTIKLQIEALKTGDDDGVGTIQVDITGQGKADSALEIYFYPFEDDEYDYQWEGESNNDYPAMKSAVKAEVAESPIKLKPSGNGTGDDAYETYFKDSFQLPSGVYEMWFYLKPEANSDVETELGPYDVTVVGGKTTIISGLVPLETYFKTLFSSPEGNLKYKAIFEIGTAEAHIYAEHMKVFEPVEEPQKVSLEERPKPELGEVVIHDQIDPDTPVSLKNKPFEPTPKERYIIVNVSFVEKQVETTLNCKLLEEDGETVFIDLEAAEKGTYKYKTEERIGSSTYAIPESALPKEKNVTIYVIRNDQQDAVKPVAAVSKPIALGFINRNER